MYKKACKIVFLVIKPIAFVEFPLPSPSSNLKVPNVETRRPIWIHASNVVFGVGELGMCNLKKSPTNANVSHDFCP